MIDRALFRTGALLVSFALCPSAKTQVTGGTISGTVTDPSSAAIPGASVTILSQGKGQTRATFTNAQGFYSVPNLVPGRYDMTVSAPGFKSTVEKNVLMEVGQEAAVNITLTLGDISEKIEKTADTTGLPTTSSPLSNVVGGQTVRDLPINGRDWTLLAALEPGVHTIEAQSPITIGNARANRGFGTQMTIGGNRPQEDVYRLDGVLINDSPGGGPGSVWGGALGVDAIQEFSVITGNAAANYGRTSGGVINAVTLSGQNVVHGSAYEFMRNSALDAANFFDVLAKNTNRRKPPFKRNQFGFSAGGPVYLPRLTGPAVGYNGKNKTFFFVDYEGLRQDLGTTSTITVPSRAARRKVVDPKLVPFLAIFPLAPSGSEKGDFGQFSFSAQGITKENLFTVRLDHKLSDVDSLSGTFLPDHSDTRLPDNYNSALLGQKSGRQSVAVEETHIFGATLLNIARIGYSGAVVRAPINLGAINPLAADTSLGFRAGVPVGSIVITGIETFNGGVGGVGQTDFHYNSYQGYDDLLYTQGKHSLKFGVALERIQSSEFNIGDPLGRFTFGSWNNFAANQPDSFNATLVGANPTIYLRQTVFGAYVQDDYRVRPNLTLNLGLRYEIATVPTEKFNHLSNLIDLRGVPVQPRLGSPYFANPTLKNVSPRLGFAWDPFGNGKTAGRGGFEIYDPWPLTYQFGLLVANTNPFSQAGSVQLKGTLDPSPFPLGGFTKLKPTTLRYSYVEPNPRRSYVQQWNLNIQRQLPASIVLLVGYVGEHGLHQPFRTNDANGVIPTLTPQGLLWTPANPKLNSMAGVINALAGQASNTYHGMNLNAQRQQKGLRLGVSYTWSKSIDNSSASIAGGTFTNGIVAPLLLFPQFMRGVSDFDVRHNLVFNYLWEIPGPRSAERFVGWATNGWQTGGIFRVACGLPFTPTIGGDHLGMKNANPFDFPDRIKTGGCSDPTNPRNPEDYIKRECFPLPNPRDSRLGNSGRNSVTGPGIRTFDLSLIKNSKFGERFNLQFRSEFFNVFNHTNCSLPDRIQSKLYDSSFGSTGQRKLKSTSTTARQIQFALKLTF